MSVGGQAHAPAALPPGNTCPHYLGDLVGFRAGLYFAENLAPHRNSIPGTSSA